MRLIDADDLKEFFRWSEVCRLSIKEIIDIIDNAPTVEITEEQSIDKLHETGWLPMHDKEMTERPQGEWIEGYHDYFETLDCSLCGYVRDNRYATFNFCPSCGADMRGK